MLRRLSTALLAALLAALPLRPALAQAYADRPIRVIVPVNPGGGTDVFARQLAELVGTSLGQPIIVENRPGASGTIGVQQVAEARPDGHVLGFVWNTPVTAAPHTLGARYAIDGFAPVLRVAHAPFALCARPDFPAATLAGMVAAIRARPGEYSWGNEGLGGVMHLGVERVLRRLGLEMTTVPFQGAGQTLPAFLGGHITFYGGSVVGAMPAIRAGSARCLMLTTEQGAADVPGSEGLDSLGLGEMAVTIWWGLIAPNGLPADRLAAIVAAFTAAAGTERFRTVVAQQGAVHGLLAGEAFGRAIRAESDALGQVARDLGLLRPAAR